MNPIASRLFRLAFSRGGFVSNLETWLGFLAGGAFLYVLEIHFHVAFSQVWEGGILAGAATLSNQLLGGLSWVRKVDAAILAAMNRGPHTED